MKSVALQGPNRATQLESRMMWPEFLSFFEARPWIKKAELIQGIAYFEESVPFLTHGEPHSQLMGWLSYYHAHTPFTKCGSNATIRLSNENPPQSDGVLFIEGCESASCHVDESGFLAGAPDFVFEVADTCVWLDLGDKKTIFQQFGVKEYLVWRVLDQSLDWFRNQDTSFEQQEPDSNGILKSLTFPGLWLDVPSLLKNDPMGVLNTLQAGLGSPDHLEFVGQLANRRGAAS